MWLEGGWEDYLRWQRHDRNVLNRVNELIRDAQEIEDTRKVMGDNPWPCGIKANEKTLKALFQYSHEQGLAKKRLTIEELFHPATLDFAEA